MRHLVACLIAASLLASCSPPSHKAPVNDQASAVALAKEAWAGIYDKTRSPAYSKENTEKFEPYTAVLKDGEWTVRATVPVGYRGSVLETTVRQRDGAVSVTTVEGHSG